MGMGAPKPGSTLPPQGGKGGVQQPGVQQPGFPQQSQVPARREGLGQMFPNYTFPQVQPPPPRSPSIPTPRPQVQPPMPPQGGKGGVYQPMPGQVPPQGGKATYTANTIGPDGRPIGAETANQYNAAKGAGTVQPGQVPPQGGKAGGVTATPEQLAALQAQLDASRPVPQVQQPTTTTPSNVPAYAQPYVNALQPQVIPQQRSSNPTDVLTPLQQPQVMPRPVPQVMPRQPTPKPAPLGLAGLQNMLYGGRR